MIEELTLWDDPAPRRVRRKPRRRWARCDDCQRRVWAADSILVGPDGKRRGDKCRRAWARSRRRLRITSTVTVRPPGLIPGQTAIPIHDQEDDRA